MPQILLLFLVKQMDSSSLLTLFSKRLYWIEDHALRVFKGEELLKNGAERRPQN